MDEFERKLKSTIGDVTKVYGEDAEGNVKKMSLAKMLGQAIASASGTERTKLKTLVTDLVNTAGADPTLQNLTLSALTVASGADPGTVVGAIGNKHPWSTLSVIPNDGRFVIDTAGANLVVGLTRSRPNTRTIVIRETLGVFQRDNAFEVTITGSQGGGGFLKATNIGASIMEQGVRGGSVVVAAGRRPIRLPVRIKRMRVIIPVFSLVTGGTVPITNGNAHVAQLFANVRSFQRGVNPVWNPDSNAAPTGRRLFTFNGGATKTPTFDPATWDTSKVAIESDWMDIDIPANQEFEWCNAVRAPSGQVPYTLTAYGDRQAGHQIVAASTDVMANDGLATLTGFAGLGATPLGGTFYDNAIIEFETDADVPQVLLTGDSNTYAFAYDFGDPEGVAGMLARSAQNRRNWLAVNLGRGADGDYNQKVQANGALLRKLAEVIHAVAPFKTRFHAYGGNDVTKTYSAVPTYGNGAAVVRGDVAVSNGNGVYICTKGGTTKASGGLTGAGRNIADNDVLWAQFSSATAGADQQAAQMAAAKMLVMDYWRASLPNIPVYDVCVVPQTTSTDNWTTVANQAVNSSNGAWGANTSRRGRLNALIRGLFDLWQTAGYVDPNPYIEDGYVAGQPATETSKFKADGVTPKLYAIDGTHLAEFGAQEGAKMLDGVAL